MTAQLEIRNLTLAYPKANRRVFDSVDLTVTKGDSVVLIGPSGQGKTSLIKVMAGLVGPSSGVVAWQGRDISTFSKLERQKRLKEFGMLFQRNALFDSLSIFENVAFPLRVQNSLLEAEINSRVMFYLRAVDLVGCENLFPSQISGGMQKRLGIARALALEPKVIFYDDPTAGLDPVTSRNIISLILELKRKFNSTLISVTNDMRRAFQLGDKIIFVDQRKIIETGSPEQTLDFPNDRVQQFIRGRVEGPLTEE